MEEAGTIREWNLSSDGTVEINKAVWYKKKTTVHHSCLQYLKIYNILKENLSLILSILRPVVSKCLNTYYLDKLFLYLNIFPCEVEQNWPPKNVSLA